MKEINLNLDKQGEKRYLRGSSYGYYKRSGYIKIEDCCEHISLNLYDRQGGDDNPEYDEEISIDCKVCKKRFKAIIGIN